MSVTIKIPTKDEILSKRDEQNICLSFKDESDNSEKWSENLSADKKELLKNKGVYVHLLNDEIVYIGKATGKNCSNAKDTSYGCFLERFRREFQQKASGKRKVNGKEVYGSKLWEDLEKHKPIKTVVFTLDEIDKLVKFNGEEISDSKNNQDLKISKALIFEQAMIAKYFPRFNNEK